MNEKNIVTIDCDLSSRKSKIPHNALEHAKAIYESMLERKS